MAKDEEKILEDIPAPTEQDIFAQPINEELSAKEIFAGDDDFLKLLEQSNESAAKSENNEKQTSLTSAGPEQKFSPKKILLAALVFLIATGLYAATVLLERVFTPVQPVYTQPNAITEVSQTETVTAEPESIAPVLLAESISLLKAQQLFDSGDYTTAAKAYQQLSTQLPADAGQVAMRDFFQLRIAQSFLRLNQDGASEMLNQITASSSPVVSVMANYILANHQMQQRNYLAARSRAYKALSLIDAVAENTWSENFALNVRFLAATALTRQALGLADIDKNVPPIVWQIREIDDPFAKLNEPELREILLAGKDEIDKAVLMPRIAGNNNKYSAVSAGASLEELFARFAANTGTNVEWFPGTSETRSLAEIRNRPVRLMLKNKPIQQHVTCYAGSSGLLATMDGENIQIHDISSYKSLSDQIYLLSNQAVSLWRNFILTNPDANLVVNAHFAMAQLHTALGNQNEAISEYKLIAGRFQNHRIAPFALYHSSELSKSIRDHRSARNDLVLLVEFYPHSEVTSKAYASLADTNLTLGDSEEAARLYARIYHQGYSIESRKIAALGAANSSIALGDHQSTTLWLDRYIELAKNEPTPELYHAYYLFGNTLLDQGKYEDSTKAFQYAIAGQLPRTDYLNAVFALIQSYSHQQNYTAALDVIENIQLSNFSSEDSNRVLIAKSKVLAEMGLVSKAISDLKARAEYVPAGLQKATLLLQAANNYQRIMDHKSARDILVDMLAYPEIETMTDEIMITLSKAYLGTGEVQKAISLCNRIINGNYSTDSKEQARRLLATAYDSENEFENAALALLGKTGEVNN